MLPVLKSLIESKNKEAIEEKAKWASNPGIVWGLIKGLKKSTAEDKVDVDGTEMVLLDAVKIIASDSKVDMVAKKAKEAVAALSESVSEEAEIEVVENVEKEEDARGERLTAENLEERLEAILEESDADFLGESSDKHLEGGDLSEGLMDRMLEISNAIHNVVQRESKTAGSKRALDTLKNNFGNVLIYNRDLKESYEDIQRSLVSLNKTTESEKSLKELKDIKKAITAFAKKLN